jgi:hypothetical protein
MHRLESMYIIIKLLYLLQFLHHFKASTLPFSVRFQNRFQRFARFCNLEDTSSTFFLKKSRGKAKKLSRIDCSCSLSVLGFGPIPAKSITRGHSLGRLRPIHRQVKRLSSNARTGSAKCDGVPICVKCTSL